MTTSIAKRVPLLDLEAHHGAIREEVVQAITRVVDSQQFQHGEEVRQLENQIAAYTRVSRWVGCGSGSDTLYLALLAAGAGPGDIVVTTPFSFFATAGSITGTEAVPAFVDIQPDTFNIDPERVARAVFRVSSG